MNFKEVLNDIKDVKIQGAESIAIAGVEALELKGASVKKLLSVRPTEPMLKNSLKAAKIFGIDETLKKIKEAREKYTNLGIKVVKKVVFTHCHSSSVISVLKKAKEKGKKFEVINTETRPKYQGRKTSKELAKARIKVTEIADAAAALAFVKDPVIKDAGVMLIGCDAILSDGSIINKIGSGMFAEIAYDHKVPVYILSNSWKFSSRPVKIEMRNYKEIWKDVPKNIKIKNPAFEKVDAKYITAIISELGILNPKKFVKKVKKVYKWI